MRYRGQGFIAYVFFAAIALIACDKSHAQEGRANASHRAYYDDFEAGNAEAACEIAAHLSARGQTKDALIWNQKGAILHAPKCLQAIAEHYEKKGSAPSSSASPASSFADYHRALLSYQADVENNPAAAIALADSIAVREGLTNALPHYSRAAQAGAAEAQYLFGRTLLQEGQHALGVFWLERASAQNHSDAALLLAQNAAGAYAERIMNNTVYADFTTAKHLAEPQAMLALSLLHAQGIGGAPKDRGARNKNMQASAAERVGQAMDYIKAWNKNANANNAGQNE